ncbi:MAG TPA: J domain-containing protein, partial [Pseudolabrys sp.]|nr:J domain-containing protein [Pseudolabrys sp.]
PGCTLDQLKDAYRRLVKTWHPDHYSHHEVDKRAVAEQRMREINRAFRSLSDYHRRNGRLPAIEDAAFKIAEPDAAPFRPPNEHFEADNGNDWEQPAPQPAGMRPWRFILFGAVLAVLWATWNASQQRDATPEETTPTEASMPAPGTNAAAPPTVGMPAASQNNSYFTVGSALGEVYAVQGVPTRIKDGVWFYGKSKVFFVDGAVASWEEDPDYPLKTEQLMETSPATPMTFGIGSTKEEVKAIQGNPLSENNVRWDYGMSQVFFQDGKVTGWYESPLKPLKIHK